MKKKAKFFLISTCVLVIAAGVALPLTYCMKPKPVDPDVANPSIDISAVSGTLKIGTANTATFTVTGSDDANLHNLSSYPVTGLTIAWGEVTDNGTKRSGTISLAGNIAVVGNNTITITCVGCDSKNISVTVNPAAQISVSGVSDSLTIGATDTVTFTVTGSEGADLSNLTYIDDAFLDINWGEVTDNGTKRIGTISLENGGPQPGNKYITIFCPGCQSQAIAVTIDFGYAVDGTDWVGRESGTIGSDFYSIDSGTKKVTYSNPQAPQDNNGLTAPPGTDYQSQDLVIPKKILINSTAYRTVLGKMAITGGEFTDNANFKGKLTISEGITEIGDYCFPNMDNTTDIIIPSTVTSLGKLSFFSCTNTQNMEFHSTIPPTLGTDALTGLTSLLFIKVPAVSVATYKTAWPNFSSKIVEL